MAYRLMSHHRLRFSPQYISSSAALYSKTQKRLLTLEVSTPQDFDEKVLKSSLPVIIDFHASWCNPCKTLGPILTQVMSTYDGKANFAKIDVDELQDLAMEYGVMSVPTVLALKDGKIVDQFVGIKQADELHQFVDNVIKQ